MPRLKPLRLELYITEAEGLRTCCLLGSQVANRTLGMMGSSQYGLLMNAGEAAKRTV